MPVYPVSHYESLVVGLTASCTQAPYNPVVFPLNPVSPLAVELDLSKLGKLIALSLRHEFPVR
ncbi:hypothetical protein D3C74_472410 [compost metagenome]